MIVDATEVAAGSTLTTELVIVGAGPAGIVAALEAEARGVEVILLDSGSWAQDARTRQLSVAERADENLHAPVELAVGRQIGGTSSMWGGRCVPYDPVDFAERDLTADSPWPVTYAELEPYFAAACEWSVCGRPVFSTHDSSDFSGDMIEGLPDDDEVLTSSLERWSLPTDFGRQYRQQLTESRLVRVVTGATCVAVECEPADELTQRRASGVRCATLDGARFTVEARDIVLAAGGLESTRLLLASAHPDTGAALGNHSDQLGRWYMAHLEGVIADLELSPAGRPAVHDYEADVDGVFVRRRFTFSEAAQLEHGLPNIAGWIANPEMSDASHRSPELSFTYLALVSPLGHLFAPEAQRLSLTGTPIPGAPYGTAHRSSVWAHLLNLFRAPLATLAFAFGFGVRRVFSRGRKPPGFFVARPDGVYPFQYHAEHLPHAESRVRLADAVDDVGMPRLHIDIRFTDDDLRGVVAAHERWDARLRGAGVGRLRYHDGDPMKLVRARTGGGFHQVGTTRMSVDPANGVVDAHLAVHGVPNLHVASSSVFPTSGQANSTFMIVVFVLRLVDRLYGERR